MSDVSGLDDPGSPLGDSWPRFEWRSEAGRARGIGLENGRTKPHRDGDLVVRREESFPPRLTLAVAGHLGEETKALVLPCLNRVEIGRIVLDQRLDEGATVADVAGAAAPSRRQTSIGPPLGATPP